MTVEASAHECIGCAPTSLYFLVNGICYSAIWCSFNAKIFLLLSKYSVIWLFGSIGMADVTSDTVSQELHSISLVFVVLNAYLSQLASSWARYIAVCAPIWVVVRRQLSSGQVGEAPVEMDLILNVSCSWHSCVSSWSAPVMKPRGDISTPCHIPCPSISFDSSLLNLTLEDILPYMSLYMFQSGPDTPWSWREIRTDSCHTTSYGFFESKNEMKSGMSRSFASAMALVTISA